MTHMSTPVPGHPRHSTRCHFDSISMGGDMCKGDTSFLTSWPAQLLNCRPGRQGSAAVSRANNSLPSGERLIRKRRR